MSEVDSRAILSASARLGQAVRVGAFAVVGDGVDFGAVIEEELEDIDPSADGAFVHRSEAFRLAG